MKRGNLLDEFLNYLEVQSEAWHALKEPTHYDHINIVYQGEHTAHNHYELGDLKSS